MQREALESPSATSKRTGPLEEQQRRREEFDGMHELLIRSAAMLGSYLGSPYAVDMVGAEQFYTSMRLVKPLLEQALAMSDTDYATYFATHARCYHDADDGSCFADINPVEWLRLLRSSAAAASAEVEQRQAIIYSIYRLGFSRTYGGRGYYGHEATDLLPPRGGQQPISEEAFRQLLTRLSS